MSLTISVVIVSYNSEKFLKQAFDSFFRQTLSFNEIIVVDNHSQDQSPDIIKQYDRITKILLNQNLGYAEGANIGIRKSRSDLVLVANSDIILEPDFIDKVVQKFSRDSNLDMLSPLIKRFDRLRIDSAGQTYSLSLFPKEIGYNQLISKMDIKEKQVFSVCGAATVFRKTALDRLKTGDEYYDRDFFMFWEDFDIGWRANHLGMKMILSPEAVVYHYRSATIKKGILSKLSLSLCRNSIIKYHLIKNRYLTLIKNFQFRRFWWSLPFIFVKDPIWIFLLTISSPKIIIKIVDLPKEFKKAYQKRKTIIKAHAKVTAPK